jgi:hypothetical protein
MDTPNTATESTPLRVRRGRVASVDLYEVKDSELDILEKGSPSSIQLNFAIFLLSLAFSSIVTLCTATFKSGITQTIFVVVAVIGVLMGFYLLISWWRTRTSITAVVKGIRERIEPLAGHPQEPPSVGHAAEPTTKDEKPVG